MSKRTPKQMTFTLQFPAADIPKLAKDYRYKTSDNKEERLLKEIGPRVRQRGYYDRADFLATCEWKSERPAWRYTKNADDDIRNVTQLALSTADEHLRVCLLTALRGVDVPMASVLLHFGFDNRYPIIDFRAFEALGIPRQSYYTVETFQQYTSFCQELAAQNSVDMRTLDRALWQYSKEHQPPTPTANRAATGSGLGAAPQTP
jgi:hypothetical protein